VQSVLSLQPRVAAFDCDGTLWSGDVGEGFFSWELNQGIVSDEVVRWARPRYADYRAGNVPESVMCGEMVTMHRGLRLDDMRRTTIRYFDQYFLDNIFPEMRDLVHRLHLQGCDVWAVSSSNEWIIQAAMRHFDIPNGRILAAAVEVQDAIISDRLVRVPSGPDKPKVITSEVKRLPDVAFGNSRWDAEMLAMAKHAFAVNPNPDLEQTARDRGWGLYFPDSIRP
jgi:phosphoserine phosphatase